MSTLQPHPEVHLLSQHAKSPRSTAGVDLHAHHATHAPLSLRTESGVTLDLTHGSAFLLGSSPACALVLKGCAERHALVENGTLSALLEPGVSGRPTLTKLNGRELSIGVTPALREGDVITLGTHQLRVGGSVRHEASPAIHASHQQQAVVGHIQDKDIAAGGAHHVHFSKQQQQPVVVMQPSPHGNGIPYNQSFSDPEMDKLSPPVAYQQYQGQHVQHMQQQRTDIIPAGHTHQVGRDLAVSAVGGPVAVHELTKCDSNPQYRNPHSPASATHKLAHADSLRPSPEVVGTHEEAQQPLAIIPAGVATHQSVFGHAVAVPAGAEVRLATEAAQQVHNLHHVQSKHEPAPASTVRPLVAQEHVPAAHSQMRPGDSTADWALHQHADQRPVLTSTSVINTSSNSSKDNATTNPNYQPHISSTITSEPLHASSASSNVLSTGTGSGPVLSSGSIGGKNAFSDAELTKIMTDMLDMSDTKLSPMAQVNLSRQLGLFPAEYRNYLGSAQLKQWIQASQAERAHRMKGAQSGGDLDESDLGMGMLTLLARATPSGPSAPNSFGVPSFQAPAFSDSSLLPLMSDMTELGGWRLAPGWEDDVRRMLDSDHMAAGPRARMDSTQLKAWIKAAAKEAEMRQGAQQQQQGAGVGGITSGMQNASIGNGGTLLDRSALLSALLKLQHHSA